MLFHTMNFPLKVISVLFKIHSACCDLLIVLHTNTDHDSSAPYGNKSEIQEVLIEEQLDAWQATHFEEFLNHRIKGNIFR